MKIFKIFFPLLLIVLLSGCSGSQKEGPKLGKYTNENNSLSYLLLEDNNSFKLFFSVESSYIGIGNYKIEGDKLILSDKGKKDDVKVYTFTIDKDKLIFNNGDYAEKFFKKGTEFKYEKDSK